MTSTGLWGPEPDAPVPEAVVPEVEEKRWGAGSVALVFVLLIATQVVLAVGLIVYVLATQPLDAGDPESVDRMTTKTMDLLTSGPGLIIALVVQWVAFIGGPWLTTRFFGLKSMKRDFGLWFKKIDLAIGLGLGLTLQGLQFAITSLVDFGDSDNTNMVTDNHGIYLPLMIIGACVITPLAEELFFRGLLLRAIMRTKAGGWFPVNQDGVPARTNRGMAVLAVVVTSVIFGGLHMTTDGSLANSLPLMVFTGTIGAVFAITAIKMKRIGATVVAHCVFNTCSVFAVLISTGRLF